MSRQAILVTDGYARTNADANGETGSRDPDEYNRRRLVANLEGRIA
jgi:hypothetical protein